MQARNIVLIGFAGTGKTTVSKALSSMLKDWTIVDTDAEIEKREGKTIPRIFADQGEAYFRTVESDVIKEVMQREQQIVSTGGGAVLKEENRKHMLAHGMVVALTASFETIVNRVKGDQNRPLFHGQTEEKVARLMEERKHAYDFAHLQVDTSHLSIHEVAKKILEAYHQQQS